MKRIIFCISLFAFFGSQAQQINPVPDYVFSNKMSVGRNAVTDTAAYFSIGPRYGAIRGMMPPMVTDTASMSATKRNGLLIFSIQKNKYLYWDSVGSKWAEMAGTTGTALTSGDTASMLSPYIRAAGNGLTKSGQSLLVDTASIATRARVQKAVDSLGAVKGSGTVTSVSAGTGMSFTTITTTGSVAADTTVLSTRAWRRKGLDSLAALELSISDTASMLTPYTRGSGTTNYLPKFTGSRTFGNSVAFDNGGTELLVNTTSDAGAYALQVNGTTYTLGLTMPGGGYSIVYGTSNANTRIVGDNSGGVNTYIEMRTNGSNRLRIQEDGEILLNNISDAGAYVLQVAGSIYNTTGAVFAATSGTVAIKTTSTDGGVQLQLASGGERANLARFYSNVDVGGATAGGSAASPALFFNGDSNTGLYWLSGDFIGVTTNGVNRMTWDNAGNVGIGTTTPSQPLHVVGNILTAAPSGGTAKPFKIGEAATVSPTSPNRTIRVEIDGTVYYIHAKTTND